MANKVFTFFEKNSRVTPWVTAPGDTNLSNAAMNARMLFL